MRRSSLASIALALGMAVFPLYVFPSGQPQLAHIVLLIFVALSLVWVRVDTGSIRAYYLLAALCWIIAVRQVVESMAGGTNSLSPMLYGLYNTALLIAVSNFVATERKTALKAVRIGILVSLSIAVIGVFLFGFSFVAVEGAPVRTVGTFNNPNQLGYFALCSMGIAGVVFLSNRLSRFEITLVFLACAFLAVLSLSKAAIVSFVFYLLIFFGRRRFTKTIPVLAVIATMAWLLAVYIGSGVERLKVFSRLETIGASNDDSLEARGYGILFNPDIRLLYGWGEGYPEAVLGHEVHSTVGNILISYGLVGFSIFLAFVFVLLRRAGRQFGLLPAIGFLAPVMLYGLTHNGLRFSVFWVYAAVLLATKPTPATNLQPATRPALSPTRRSDLITPATPI